MIYTCDVFTTYLDNWLQRDLLNLYNVDVLFEAKLFAKSRQELHVSPLRILGGGGQLAEDYEVEICIVRITNKFFANKGCGCLYDY